MALYTAIATSAGRDTRAATSDGRLDVKLALQKEFGGDGDGTNPEQLFAAGWAACFASSIHLVARRRRWDATGTSVTAEVGVHPLAAGGFTFAATMRVTMPAHLSAADRETLVDEAHHVCPYSNATRDTIPVRFVIDNGE